MDTVSVLQHAADLGNRYAKSLLEDLVSIKNWGCPNAAPKLFYKPSDPTKPFRIDVQCSSISCDHCRHNLAVLRTIVAVENLGETLYKTVIPNEQYKEFFAYFREAVGGDFLQIPTEINGNIFRVFFTNRPLTSKFGCTPVESIREVFDAWMAVTPGKTYRASCSWSGGVGGRRPKGSGECRPVFLGKVTRENMHMVLSDAGLKLDEDGLSFHGSVRRITAMEAKWYKFLGAELHPEFLKDLDHYHDCCYTAAA